MKRAAIILAEGFEEIEAFAPVDLLRRAGVTVFVVGLEAAHITGARGIRVTADILFDEGFPEMDLVILPGGLPGAKNLAEHPKLQKYLLERHLNKQLIGAICAAPAMVLGPLEILKGKRFTCYPGMDSLVPQGSFQDLPVVVDGHLITSRGVGTALSFSLELITLLLGKKAADTVAESCLIQV